MERVVEAVVPSDKILGVYAGSAAMTREWLARGARYFTSGIEPLLKDATRAHLEKVRG
jgi:hypothetical protein